MAYAKLSSMKWAGEEVDVYVNENMRLDGLARFEGPSLEHIVNVYKRPPGLYECSYNFGFIAC